MKRGLVAACLAVGGCAAIHNAMHPKSSMRQEVDGFEEWNKTHDAYGEVDRGALASGETIHAKTTVSDDPYPMILLGRVGDQLCFSKIESYSGVDSGDQAIASAKSFYREGHYAYRYFGDLAEITATTAWPDVATSDAVEIASTDQQYVKGECHIDKDLDKRCAMDHREVTVGICLKPPEIPNEAKWLGVAFVWPGDNAEHNSLVLWKLTGEPAAPAAPSEAPAADEPQ